MGTLNRVLVPLLIIALPIAAMVAFITVHVHNKNAAPPVPIKPEPAAPAIVFGDRDWPIFRGNAALTGTAAGTLPDTLKLLWRYETRAAIKSTPVVENGTVYFTSMDRHVYAADLKTGKERWWFKANDEIEASALYADDKVFVASAVGTFFALNADDGLIAWTFEAPGRVLGAANTFVDADGRRRIVFGCYDNFLYCLDAADGSLVWKHQAQSYINGACAIADGTAVFGSCDGNLYVVPLADPNQTQTIDIESYMAASPAIVDGIVYAGNYDGLFIAASLSTRQILWRFERESAPFMSAPAVTDNHLLVGAQDKSLYCLNRTDGQVLWTFAATAKINSAPVVCGNRVVFGADNGRLTILDLADGREVFAYTLGQSITGACAIADNTLLVGAEDGVLYAFGPAEP